MSRRANFVVGLFGLVAFALVGGATSSPAASTALAPVRFAPAAGWQVRVGKPHACVGPRTVLAKLSEARTVDCLASTEGSGTVNPIAAGRRAFESVGRPVVRVGEIQWP
jgi:hypothetical protein